MKQPSLDKMMELVDSKYTLVVASARRARIITETKESLVEGDFVKPVTSAMHELVNKKVICKQLEGSPENTSDHTEIEQEQVEDGE
ncbi:DNA-directed RNA polymerase subunit omega [Desulfitispora alkaliphila]|uniref:DNA-directed RNA polymerase subunit omega n=1 Tax=Desulfitispora alkaliphila TaxID=622674 RepID=UPI003D1BE06A